MLTEDEMKEWVERKLLKLWERDKNKPRQGQTIAWQNARRRYGLPQLPFDHPVREAIELAACFRDYAKRLKRGDVCEVRTAPPTPKQSGTSSGTDTSQEG